MILPREQQRCANRRRAIHKRRHCRGSASTIRTGWALWTGCACCALRTCCACVTLRSLRTSATRRTGIALWSCATRRSRWPLRSRNR